MAGKITLGDVTCSEVNAAALCRNLERYGVARVEKFLSGEDARLIRQEAEFAISKRANYSNPYGPCTRFSLNPLPPHLARSRDLVTGRYLDPLPAEFVRSRAVIDSGFFREVTRSYLGPHGGFMEVVAFTRDQIPDPHAVYGKLHYDRRHQLKIIIYLNDVDESNGAFGCIPGSRGLGHSLFCDGWRRALGLKTSISEQIEAAANATAEDQPEYRLVPCVLNSGKRIGPFDPERDQLMLGGDAGTLVVFDTHILHFGGFIATDGKERWTLKGHTLAWRDDLVSGPRT